MSTPSSDTLRAFLDALGPARAQLHITQTVHGMIHAAVRDHGWTTGQLAAECRRDLDGVVNVGALITHRLRHAAGHPPPAAPTRTGLPVTPLCGHCTDGWIEDPDTRLPVERCPCRHRVMQEIP